MPAAQILVLLNAANQIAATVLPLVQDSLNKGDISKEDQEKLIASYNSLKAAVNGTGGDGQFSGPQWQIR